MSTTGFTRKKVESMTLGEKLKKIRSEYRISLNEVAKQTKIQMKYLEYLENGEYEKLPAEVYVRGFVRSYAHFLGTDDAVLVKLYEREKNIQRNLKKEQFQDTETPRFYFPRFIITPRVFLSASIVLGMLLGCVYLYREFQSFASVPRLVVIEPTDGQHVSDDTVWVRGTTDKDASLTLNGQPVLVRDGGEFADQVRLQSGLNTLTLSAMNSFKKEKVVTLMVQAEYTPVASLSETPDVMDIPAVALKKKFEVTTLEKELTVSVEVDGNRVYSGVLDPTMKQVFEVEKELRISSEDGSKTLVRGSESATAEPISTTKGSVKDVLFIP